MSLIPSNLPRRMYIVFLRVPVSVILLQFTKYFLNISSLHFFNPYQHTINAKLLRFEWGMACFPKAVMGSFCFPSYYSKLRFQSCMGEGTPVHCLIPITLQGGGRVSGSATYQEGSLHYRREEILLQSNQASWPVCVVVMNCFFILTHGSGL